MIDLITAPSGQAEPGRQGRTGWSTKGNIGFSATISLRPRLGHASLRRVHVHLAEVSAWHIDNADILRERQATQPDPTAAGLPKSPAYYQDLP
jgi:hypothetical protein